MIIKLYLLKPFSIEWRW